MSRYISLPYQWGLDNNGTVAVFGQGATLPSGSTVSITEVGGLDMPDIGAVVTPLSNDDGSTVAGLYHAERTITLSGRVNSAASLYATDVSYLKGLFASSRRTSTAPAVLEFQFFGQVAQVVYGVPTSIKYAVRNIETAVGWVDFLATMVCGDPRIYSSSAGANSGVTLNPGGVSGGVAFPVTFPFTFSTSSAGTVSAFNAGNYWAPTTITLNGPMVNPKITNTTTGDFQQLLLSISAGSTVVIDSLDRTILFNGSSGYSTMSASSTFIELQPGMNTIQVGVDSGSGTGTIVYSDTWV